ncbi:aminotransferase class V-fold PLP-dependent enzyme [Candidatus Leptofilum sp.]|uniref:aminotransferase class V-fold PLP-dependent enzyme n=1 Tax=Candidatus Leptofilum sp. TaxID=3241576 RepID=UPI003B5A708C
MSTNATTSQQSASEYTAVQKAAMYEQFLKNYPEYGNTMLLDEWRRTEYGRLDTTNQIYLDYTGGGLYAESQLDAHMAILKTQVLGNPHSANPTSLAMTDMVEGTRSYILNYFNANPNEYIAVFTMNASNALKLVGEAYPFTPGSHYLLTYDNHNSVNGIREFARNKGAEFSYVPLTTPSLRIDEAALNELLAAGDPAQHNLFAFPAQSNFSGVKHPLELVELVQKRGWDVCLDAAAFVPTGQLDLSQVKPEFVTMSFYKMFGYPTGLGALLIRKSVLDKLRRPWFAGGTVNFASVQAQGHYLAPNEAAFEDGTVNYLNIPAIKIGLAHLQEVGMETIGERVRCLTGWLIDELMGLVHENGRPMIRLYGPTNTDMRGGTVTLNFYDPDGRLLDYRRIEELANEQGISLRTGCFCNPGAGEIAEGLTREDMLAGLAESEDMTLPRFMQLIQHRGNKSAGAIRISVGLATNFADVYRFMQFAASFRNKTNLNIGKATFDIASCRVIRDGS